MSQLGGAINISVEAYPTIQTTQQYKDFQAVQEGTENRLAVAIRDWNQSITDYNTKLVKFPANLIAGLFGYTAKANYKSDEGAKDTKVDFSK
jgi:LemA protein